MSELNQEEIDRLVFRIMLETPSISERDKIVALNESLNLREVPIDDIPELIIGITNNREKRSWKKIEEEMEKMGFRNWTSGKQE